MSLSEKLIHIMDVKNVKVNELSLRSGVSSANISRIRNGDRQEPNYITVGKLAKGLRIPVEYFMEGEASSAQAEVAAHIWEGITDEQMEDIIKFIEYIKFRDKEK